MKYMGSKARIKNEILPIILENRKDGQCYVEPFAGGMNTISHVDGYKIANDNNKYLIEMFKGLQKGNTYPNLIPKEIYDVARDTFNGKLKNDISDDYIGWIGYMGSANGRFFDGGYSGVSITKEGKERDYIRESISNISKQLDSLKDIDFVSGHYEEMYIPENSIIYCDPPYSGTKQYSTSKDFNHNRFFEWCREKSKEGHSIFVSEYNAPSDFKIVWEKQVKSSLSANSVGGGNKNSIEKLFTL